MCQTRRGVSGNLIERMTFGVEAISPDLVYLTDEYPTHKACAVMASRTSRT